MYSFKYRYFFKLVLCFVLFFTLSLCVEAKYSSYKTTDLNVFANCDGTNCVPLCIYTCENEEKGCFSSGFDYAYIGHYFSDSKEFVADSEGIKKIWDIGVIRTEGDSTFYSWTEDALPSSNIVVNNVNWNDSAQYLKLSKNYVCPSYVFMGIFDLNVSSSKQNQMYAISKNIDFIGLSYSFIDEFEKVLNDLELEAKIFDLGYEDIDKNDRVNEFLKIMNIAGLYGSYDSSLSSEENIKKFCSSNTVATAKNYVKEFSVDKMVDAMLSESLKTVDVKFPNVYEYSNLQTLFVSSLDNNVYAVDSSGNSYIDRINNLYKDVNLNMIKYLNEDCDWNISESDLNQAIDEQLKSQLHELNPIDLDERFDCNNLFAGDVADLISGAYFIVEIVAILILVIFTVLDYAKSILNGDDNEIKKCNQKLMKRLIIVVVIFLLPALVNLVLRVFNIEGFNSDNPLCIRISNK